MIIYNTKELLLTRSYIGLILYLREGPPDHHPENEHHSSPKF